MKTHTSNLRVGTFKRAHFIEMPPKKRMLHFAEYYDENKKETLELSFPYVQFWPSYTMSFMTCSFLPLDFTVDIYDLPLPHIIPSIINGMQSADIGRVCSAVEPKDILSKFWSTRFSYGYNVWGLIKEDIHRWHNDGELFESKQTKIDPNQFVSYVLKYQTPEAISEILTYFEKKGIIKSQKVFE